MRTPSGSLFFFGLLSLSLWGCGGLEVGTNSASLMANAQIELAAPAVLSRTEKQMDRFAMSREENFEVTSGQVRKGQSLSHVLSPLGVSGQTLHRIATVDKETFDVRRMRPGKEWHLFHTPDGEPRFFAYTITAKEYVVFDLSEAGGARRGKFPSQTRRRFIEGEVNSSLSQTLEDAGHTTTLALGHGPSLRLDH